MSIRRGEDWGAPEPVPDDAVVAGSDRDAAIVAAEHRRANTPIPPIMLTGGDLARTLGGGRQAAGERTHVRVDLGAVLVDGTLHWFLAHLVARRSWFRGRIVVAANAAFLGDWNVAPRAHPGDGRLDLVDGDPSVSDRLKARTRLRTGTHLPHPEIRTRRVEAVQLDLGRSTPIRLDGHQIGSGRSLSIRVEPGAVDIWI